MNKKTNDSFFKEYKADVEFFEKAKPIWTKNQERYTVLGLYTFVKGDEVELKIATSGNYRIFINGEFYCNGPARAAHDFFRVDELSINSIEEEKHIAIEVINYKVGSFSDLRQDGFIQVEISNGEDLIAATGISGFTYNLLTERIRKTQRYSFQRPWAESYKLTSCMYDWRIGKKCSNALSVEIVETQPKKLINRNIKNFTYPKIGIKGLEAIGTLETGVIPEEYRRDRSVRLVIDPPNKTPEGYTFSQMEQCLTDEYQEMKNITFERIDKDFSGKISVKQNEFEIIYFETEKAGFLFADIQCKNKGTLYILFDEILVDGDVEALRLGSCNVIRFDAEEGNYSFQSAESYGMKYLKVVCSSGEFNISNIGMCESVCSQPIIDNFDCEDVELKKIYFAAKESFKQNVVDIFMDCPTRERAGWLCDSFFEAKSEQYFTGENVVEYNFLENYLLPETFHDVPNGMVPMCYPADHWDGEYIPNWALWLILELYDYRERTKDTILIDKFKKRVYGIFEWFKQYENSDGLIEKLPGWVFIEWSKANDFVQDINYPSNMIYSYALELAGCLYNDDTLIKKSNLLKKIIVERSYNGEFFCDNEIYIDGKSVLSGEKSETCQYYAFFTRIATPETFPELWSKLINEFGPSRIEKGLYLEVHSSNAFIGNFLRLHLLSEKGMHEQVLNEIKGYFLHMAQRTGTLWEYSDESASCNHGFSSYVAVLIYKALANK